MMTANEIRAAFLDFFASKQHHIVPSAPMVVKGDPTLMFTNAGMNQFKDIILGNAEAKYPRVADSQKCLRVSGKHNDLEEVGHDTYHHTMFEMLGNWSFGDYFKEEAITWAWEFLHERLGIPADCLYATVFEGAAEDGLERDNEAASIWERYLPKERILNGNKKDNFWEMGDTGPCGPCSEIHIDLRIEAERAEVSGRDLINRDHPQVVEIWNLVFMQYNRLANGSLSPLPHRVIDTGMGFERLCMAMQGKRSNYDTDVFQPIIQAIANLSGIAYGHSEKTDIAMRVIADHVRTIAFAITDGQLPSNAKAGYVIRRILRRAVRYGYTFLNRKEAFMYALLPVLIDCMGSAYPELIAQKDLIVKVMKEEEDSFLRTLESGMKLLDRKIEEFGSEGTLSGHDAFVLYDTFGFPLDLTELILREHNMSLDQAGFDEEMAQQKARARNAALLQTEDWVVLQEGDSLFVGYDRTDSECRILRYRKVKQKNKDFYQVVLSQSPFYAEMGGQVGDSGYLLAEDNSRHAIRDTKRENNLPVHLMDKLPDDLSQTFHAYIDTERRRMAEANHTATHLLHKALRDVLGEHVEQKGSFVSPEVLRFDFAHYNKLTPEEIRRVEEIVSSKIRQDIARQEFRNVPIEEAKNMGAMALFGEKYGEEVRVLQYGDSIELCGGTHLPSTGMIGSFRIVSESSIAAGIRRIEAVTGSNAERYLYEKEDTLTEIKALFNNNPKVVNSIRKLIEEEAQLRLEIDQLLRKQMAQKKAEILAQKDHIGSIRFLYLEGEYRADSVKDIAFQLRGELDEPFIFLAATKEGEKCLLSITLSDAAVALGANASNLVRSVSTLIKGGGGGQPHFATAGGKDIAGLPKAVEHIKQEIQSL
ncbi:alanine--tRNA ligase [Porphyromonas circumdentaria]|uniref:alanine--tRNA ligase n=1 Tax=Porphyromonas circumdentaria TaxID=29524 RepID=UPI0026DABC52|nr:alanine--tRNA ligase [Porphyromonas circumdentaria]MDO4722846.1 alanine--tRNA ligase [Porphyromonas circumdentaria]